MEFFGVHWKQDIHSVYAPCKKKFALGGFFFYMHLMPNQRSKKQKGVLVMMDENFREEIDEALPKTGFSDRSAFIRNAVYRRLEELGIEIPAELQLAPGRKQKGGTPTHKQKVNIGKVTGGRVEITQKKKSTSTYDAPGIKGAANKWLMNEDAPKPKKGNKK
jgi:Arc/MetJ-type ribon-helix-helix transcriptional regulator